MLLLQGVNAAERTNGALVVPARFCLNSFAVGRHQGVSLTRRQREVADLLVEGLPNKAIAQRLFLSSRTVEEHIQNLFTLFGCNNRTELAVRLRSQPAASEQGNLPSEVGAFVGREA